LGVSGGYICGSRGLIDWLINRARSFIFSTAPPPALAAAATAAIEFLGSADGEARRLTLWRRIVRLKDELGTAKAALRKSESAILPWIVGDAQRALDFSRALRQEGLFVPAIRFPTVAKGAARLRISLSASHTEPQIAKLGEALSRLAKDYGWEAAERRSNGVGT
ncbi:MAG TPA: aminotransferase class I/II-fold pyridoxal phosphate-dependent enzyme, partial [Chthoniobacterales bacterium]|nr:aminotransferase class I/II-fold pyridoxal phosphate-dependent enzyme [Chthoniobacterales bacterium]